MALRRRKTKKKFEDTPADLLVVGLGNPGDEYEGTRHNVGVEVVHELCDRHNGQLKPSREAALKAELRIDAKLVVVGFPQTYMNLSGEAVRSLVRRYSIDDLDRLVIVHDELDIEPGRLKVKHGGGLAGHNGLKSIRDHLHSADFVRCRLGVGRPPGRMRTSDWVLKRPGRADRDEIDHAVVAAADAVEALVNEPIDAVMNRFNRS